MSTEIVISVQSEAKHYCLFILFLFLPFLFNLGLIADFKQSAQIYISVSTLLYIVIGTLYTFEFNISQLKTVVAITLHIFRWHCVVITTLFRHYYCPITMLFLSCNLKFYQKWTILCIWGKFNTFWQPNQESVIVVWPPTPSFH